MPLSCECFVLSGKGFCDGPISCPEESFRVGVTECDQMQQEPSAHSMSR
jgi:hypothetical protein